MRSRGPTWLLLNYTHDEMRKGMRVEAKRTTAGEPPQAETLTSSLTQGANATATQCYVSLRPEGDDRGLQRFEVAL
jgi:hypothetical protein